jgi:hypothetical protein
MREDHLESLEKMFPRGYVMIYTCPDGSMRVSMFNPQGYDILFEQYTKIKERWGLNE